MSGKLYCCYSNPKGPLEGESSFTVKGIQEFLRADNFGDEYYIVGKREDGICVFLKYYERDEMKEETKKDRDDVGNDNYFNGVIESAPILIGRSFPTDSSFHTSKDLVSFYVFSKNLIDFEIKIDGGWSSMSRLVQGRLKPIQPIGEFFKASHIPVGRGIQLRVNSKNGGTISGLSFYFDSKEPSK